MTKTGESTSAGFILIRGCAEEEGGTSSSYFEREKSLYVFQTQYLTKKRTLCGSHRVPHKILLVGIGVMGLVGSGVARLCSKGVPLDVESH